MRDCSFGFLICQLITYSTEIQCIRERFDNNKLLLISAKFFFLSKFVSICLLTILVISLKSWSCKNDHIIFNVGTSSLEARNIRLVNRITSINDESKLIEENMPPNVKHHQFHVFQTLLYRLLRPDNGSSPRNFILSRNLEYLIVFIKIYFI